MTPRIWVDFNSVEVREDGKHQVVTAWVDGLSLREPVMAYDGDGFEMPGFICGLLDHGRGPMLVVELGRR